jgi:hypothetical protein
MILYYTMEPVLQETPVDNLDFDFALCHSSWYYYC